jgi:2-keto-3-deoxy-L-rhamnonate aldolase RhmA
MHSGSSRMTLVNPVKQKIARGEVAFGISVRLTRSGEIARIARATGHDFLYIDLQHAMFNLETIGHITHAALGCGVAPIVRTRGASDPDLSLMLDAGVLGLVIPNVETVDDAQRVVDAAKFAPVGKRSISGASPHFDYQSVPTADLVEMLDKETLVILMIESVEGLKNIETIGAVPGIDGLYLGMGDMLISMGKAGQSDDPEIFEALHRLVAVARDNHLIAGCGGVDDVERQLRTIRGGVQFLTTQSDLSFVMKGASQAIASIRSGLEAQA